MPAAARMIAVRTSVLVVLPVSGSRVPAGVIVVVVSGVVGGVRWGVRSQRYRLRVGLGGVVVSGLV